MMGYIQKNLSMMKSRNLVIKWLAFFFLSVVLANSSFADNFPVAHAVNSQGEWQEGEITQREVIFTDRLKVKSKIIMDVPLAGKYQLFAYAHHNWRRRIPCIYVEASDSQGKTHRGSACIENCWYFRQDEVGRWFMVCLSENPYWVLPQGKLQIEFWLDAKESIWGNNRANPEGKISIEDFFLFAVGQEESIFSLPGIIYPETGKGNWRIFDYHPEYGTDLVLSDKPGSSLDCKINIPVSGYYQGWISLLADSDGLLKIWIGKEKFKRKITDLLLLNEVKLKKTKNWVLVPSASLYLKKGEYILSFKNYKSRILIDYFLLLPLLTHDEG